MAEFRTIASAGLRASQAYGLLISVLVPRPIAWVTSRSRDGVVNAAPFSFYAGISAVPPILGLGIGRRRDGSPKDTARNILEGREFVVHLAEEENLEELVATSAEHPPEVGEPEELGLELQPSETVAVPALACARVRLECVLHRHLEVGEFPVDFILGEIRAFRIHEELLDEDGAVREERLHPVARLGGSGYAPVRERLEVPRPPRPAST